MTTRLRVNSLTTAGLGRGASKGTDTSGKVWSVSEAKRHRETGHSTGGELEGILISVRVVLSDLPLQVPWALTLIDQRLVSLLLPWQRSSSRATSNCPLILASQLSSSSGTRYPNQLSSSPASSTTTLTPTQVSSSPYPPTNSDSSFHPPYPSLAFTFSGSPT